MHPGYGFLSENPAFVRACFENDLVFVGPSPESMEVLGDKASAKDAMGAAGLPLVPGSPGRLSTAGRGLRASQRPPATRCCSRPRRAGEGAACGSWSMPDELEGLFDTASAEAGAAFGDGGLYLEKAVVDAHHVEVQVLGDGRGARSCSAIASARCSDATRS